MSHFKTFSGALIVAAAVMVSNPLEAGTINLINDDTFSSVTPLVYQSTSYQEQEALTGTVDSYFTTIDNSLSTCATGPSCVSNVDVVGNITPLTPSSVGYNLAPYAGICAASNATADCIDLDGTGGNDQGALQAAVSVSTAGTVVLSSGILGTSGYLSTSTTNRDISTSVLIVFGNSACFTGETTAAAYASNANCLYVDNVTASNPNGVYNQTSNSIAVGAGTYYVEYISETAGAMGALLTSSSLVETTTPEPSTMILLGSALLGLGAVRWRKRQGQL